ncbi:hypothetical protein E4U36_007684 [Claviceps purpurea]|nr:hypothetical protein E4U36_007684 [Claviceps purpurea]
MDVSSLVRWTVAAPPAKIPKAMCPPRMSDTRQGDRVNESSLPVSAEGLELEGCGRSLQMTSQLCRQANFWEGSLACDGTSGSLEAKSDSEMMVLRGQSIYLSPENVLRCEESQCDSVWTEN